MFKKSILIKILSIVVGISIIGFTILIYKVISQEEKNLLEERKKTSDLMTQPILHTLYKDMLDERADMVYYLMQGVKNIKGVERIQIIRGNGVEAAFSDDKTFKTVEKEYGELKPEWKTPRIPQPTGGASGTDYPKFKEVLKAFKEGRKEGISYIEESDGKRLFTYLVPIEAQQKCNACHTSENTIRGVLMISTTLEDMYASLSDSRMRWIMYGFFTVLGASIILTLFVRTITNPLSRIAESSKKIANGELDIRVDVKSNDEIGILANVFKDMVVYLKSMAHTAEAIADRDLRGDITPKSEKDILGNAFK
ncbi:MAG: HAMP domain-containing protein, partial [Deltaproteobacteria bacterium]|nr:HAMP domain-containing protein [Deltaproteobacteria bacterium]